MGFDTLTGRTVFIGLCTKFYPFIPTGLFGNKGMII